MLALRCTLRRATLSSAPRIIQTQTQTSSFSSKSLAEVDDDSEERKASDEALEAEKSSIQKYVEATSALDHSMIWGTTDPLPDPVLPDEPSEIAALDRNQDPTTSPTINGSGAGRIVHIKQEEAHYPIQSPLQNEQFWTISFGDEGELAETCWDNPLMGWVSGSDPMHPYMQDGVMDFLTAEDAKYFCEKKGWNYIIDEPILRSPRDDDAQYQDNFLPQDVAGVVRRDGVKCNHWERPESGASHYFRPLKYHGDGKVAQHGPNPDAETVPDVKGYYKMR